jgi:hypothetical protein
MRQAIVSVVVLALSGPATVGAQDTVVAGPEPVRILTDSIRAEGIVRASNVVDSVFVDRTLPQGYVFGGDWGAYLMARLGAVPIPDDLKIAVDVDTVRIVLHTTVGDLPLIARQALGPLLTFVAPETLLEGDIGLDQLSPEIVRFRLTAVRLNGLTVPERFLQEVMNGVGRQYPKLTRTGRDLLIQVPRGAEILLAPGGVRLIGPLDEEPADTVG